MKQTEVEIHGKTYVIKGDADPDYVRYLAKFVEDKVIEARVKAPDGSDSQKLIVLAAINIADELHKSRLRQQEIEKLVRDKTGDLFTMLEDGK